MPNLIPSITHIGSHAGLYQISNTNPPNCVCECIRVVIPAIYYNSFTKFNTHMHTHTHARTHTHTYTYKYMHRDTHTNTRDAIIQYFSCHWS